MIRRERFGAMPDGREVERYILTNGNGVEVAVITYGAAITSFRAPDRVGNIGDIVLGFDGLEAYLNDNVFMGAVVGRYANRIANACFSLDGMEYELPANNGPNLLHGGPEGFYKKLWRVEATTDDSLTLSYLSPDGEEGFPGNLTTKVTYTLSDANELKLEYDAITDKPTVITLTSHAYFNLAAETHADILQHELKIEADRYLPTDAHAIPTGEIAAVKDTPFDFTEFHSIGERISSGHEQIALGKGYDRCWVLPAKQSGEFARAATLRERNSGRKLEVWTTEPGIQFYSGNFLNDSIRGRNGRVYRQHSALCLETQHFPDSPNQPQFPSTVLRPGERYRSNTVFKVSAE